MPGSSTSSSSSNERRIARRRRRTTPCGACRVLRRRCTPMCSFSRYFRPHEASRFRAFNLVFGANSYTLGLIRGFPASQRRRAFRVLVQEAHVRLEDPINGCIGVIENLERQVAALRADRDAMVIRNRLLSRILLHRVASRRLAVQQPPAVQNLVGIDETENSPPGSRSLSYSSLIRSSLQVPLPGGDVVEAGPPPGGLGPNSITSTSGHYSPSPPPADVVEADYSPPGGQSPDLSLTPAGPYWRRNPQEAPAQPETEGRAAAAAMASQIEEALRSAAGNGGIAPETGDQEPGDSPLEQLDGGNAGAIAHEGNGPEV